MGFRVWKRHLVQALLDGRFVIVHRGSIDTKNLIHSGLLDAGDLALTVMAARGTEHRVMPHNRLAGMDIHTIVTAGWYIKFYFVDLDVALVSVHRTGHHED